MDNPNDVKDLALRGSELAAKLVGIAVPAVGVLGVFIEAVNERRTKRQIERLQELIASVCQRLDRCENQIFEPSDPHLIDEILAKAVNDEDEDKTEYYAALIQYCATANRRAFEIRLLGNALKGLTIHEIESLAHFAEHGVLRHDIPEELRDIFWDRVLYLGLHQRGKIGNPEYTTLLGQKFIEVCKLAKSQRGKE